MPRPKTPLISKRKTLEVALEIIDREGLEALSIRRLAEALDVNGASLYHHFENKDAILVGVAELALADVRTPKGHDEPWQVWVRRNNQEFRKALLAHPRLMPVILNRQPLGIGIQELENTAKLLHEEGVPIGYLESILRAGEVIALGSVLEETMVGDPATQWKERYPLLYQSSLERALSPEELFDALSRSVISIFEQLIDADKQWTAERAKALAGMAAGTENGSKPAGDPPPAKRAAKVTAASKGAKVSASKKSKTRGATRS
jgi:TetR/AcrR family transcriptional regulator, tetracycline repressor protein